MILQEALELVSGFGVPERFDELRRHIDARWIEEALAATGTATVRRRRLPAEQVVWVVIGMALFRNLSIERLVDDLDLALPTERRELVAKSGITQARQRLGEEPMAMLFALLAAEWATASAVEHRWRGLLLYGADGTTMRVADSVENRAAFGGQSGGAGRGDSGYPIVRLVALMALRSHILSALRFADYFTGEPTIAKELWRELPDDSLTIVDRGFLIANELTQLERSGQNRHWLTRAKSTTQTRVLKRLGRNDALVEIELSPATRRLHPDLPATWVARAIKYQRKGFRPSLLLTSLLDAEKYPAAEIVALYHERWELELAYDEVKTHLLAREETIRSRTPDGVRQELWGIAIAYNLVRLEMERAAVDAGVEPNRISFVGALALVRNELLACSARPIAPGNIPRHLATLRLNLKRLILPERRTTRSYPRAVKLKMSNYARKRPSTGRRRK
jgi:hypothetical protein